MTITKSNVYDVNAYTLTNRSGMSITVFEYGATLTSVRVPGKDGVQELTIGFEQLDRYFERHPYFGSSVGRFANRIAKSYFTLEGRRVVLDANEGDNHLHGGTMGMSRVRWHATIEEEGDASFVCCYYRSVDGEQGYPATLDVYSRIGLSEDNEVFFFFDAESDGTTVVNLCNHAYWNLGANTTILDHQLCIHADSVVEIDEQAIPTGILLPVEDTAFDFRTTKAIGRDFSAMQHIGYGGYDHCYVINDWQNDQQLRPVAEVVDVASGRRMEIQSTLPGVQFYTANRLDALPTNRPSGLQAAFCLETQFFPDSVHHPHFPSVILHEGEKFSHKTVHRFS